MTSNSRFVRLEDVVQAEQFADVDLVLRQGRHIDQNDLENYAFLVDSQELLEPFYRRYGCELIASPAGYFFLLSSGERLGRRQLSPGAMLAGQGLALMLLDPASTASAGIVPKSQLMELLANLVGEAELINALNPRKRRRDEKVDQAAVRQEIDRALRTLQTLGFVDLLDDETIRLRTPLLRFAEPVRGLRDSVAVLKEMIARGEVTIPSSSERTDDGEDEA